MDINAVELFQNQKYLGFFNRLFLVPKPNNHWRPILDLNKLNLFFKLETLETIRTSLQQGEWVTSIDFKDTYFHIPIQEQSRKYLRFHIQGRAYQFKALPFGLSTAPLEFTVIPKEVKLMVLGPTNTGLVAQPSTENTGTAILTGLSSPAIHILDRSANSHRKASSSWPTAYETHTVESQKNNWRVLESLEKVIPIPRSLHPHQQF